MTEWREAAKKIANDNYLRHVLPLVKYGVPFDVAFSLEWPEVIAWTVIFAESEGGREFDWNSMRWIQK